MDTILWNICAAVLIQFIVVRWICVATVAERWPKLFPKALSVGLVSDFLVLLLLPVYTDRPRSQQVIDEVFATALALVASLVVVVVYCQLTKGKWSRE